MLTIVAMTASRQRWTLPGVAAIAALCLGTNTLQAQRLSQLDSGTVVKIVTRNKAVFIGPIVEARGDTVRLGEYGNYLPNDVAQADVVSYQYSSGRDRARGFITGTLIGGGIGIGLYSVVRGKEKQVNSGITPNSALMGLLAVVLTVSGAAMGQADAPEKWVNPLPDRSAAPSWHIEAQHLRVTLRF